MLSKIHELIGRYRTKIFEIGDIKNLRDSFYRSKIKKTKSPTHFLPPKIYTSKFDLPSSNRQHISYLNSFPQTKDHLNKSTIRTIFSELRNIKRSLIKSAKDIEEIFKYPKARFSSFSIDLCQREEYLTTLVNDKFIQLLISENREEEFDILIAEIEEDRKKNITQMSDFLNYLQNCSISDEDTNSMKEIDDDILSLNEDNLKFANQFPEERWTKMNLQPKQRPKQKAVFKLPSDIDELVKFIVTDEKKSSKKKKKKGKKNNGTVTNNISTINPIREKSTTSSKDIEIENFKESINKISTYSYNTQKYKTSFSQEWLNKLNKSLTNFKKS